ncbi:MAG: hypothetical protein ACE5D2_02525 [Fidelibacterota bacterium]
MKHGRLICLFVLPLALITVIKAWGYDGHRRINRQAAQVLKGPLGQFLMHNESALTWYGPVPDYLKGSDPNEFYRHFIDLDNYDAVPFNQIPMDYDSLLAKYGRENVRNWGIAPWAIQAVCDRIIKLLKEQRFDEAVYNMGILSHYVADLHMPLHTVKNYNGQLTGNDGVHFRWEARLVNDYLVTIQPVGTPPEINNPLLFAFDIARESYSVHQRILAADTKARRVLTTEQVKQLNSYDILPFEKPYLDVLYRESGDLLKEQSGLAVTRIAAYWRYCWQKAGSPELPR